MDDVLERMERFLNPEGPMYRSDGREIMEALAAEVRELRERVATERTGRERAERVAVLAAKYPVHFADSMVGGPSDMVILGHRIKCEGTDADIYRALVEACEGGKS